jgi:4-amino-4-deoxy-L-arabinose transferase-like glycosyltransferase
MEKGLTSNFDAERVKRVSVFLLILFGVAVRVYKFGEIPAGFNQDEAFAGYEAFSLLKYGVDSAGYHNPCYFVSWGSGMNVLESYLAIPFMKLLGPSVITLRLPQLILACFSLLVFYLLLHKIFSEKTALLGLGLLVISPWHIMLSRWGLESNLAPSFLLFGLYFFILGVSNNRYWIASAIMYGLSLYAYSITWLVVPLTLVCFITYIIVSKRKILYRYALPSSIVLLIFALPLILFVLVNKGYMQEITTTFISIPNLSVMRDSEISISNLFSWKSYINLLNIIWYQDDGLIWNASSGYGLFYKFSLPFILLGGVRLSKHALKSMHSKVFGYEVFLILGMLCSILICLIISNLNINKANSLHFYLLILLAVGIKEAFIICQKYSLISKAIIAIYAIAFLFFLSYYFDGFNDYISYEFREGVADAVSYVNNEGFTDIGVDSSIYYSQILFFDQTPHDEYMKTVKYINFPSAFLDVEEFGKYKFGIDYENLAQHEAYIIDNNQADLFSASGYHVVRFENYSVAHQKKAD